MGEEVQSELFVTTGRLSTSPDLIKRELISARRLIAGATIRMRNTEAILQDAKQRGSRAEIIRAECDVGNIHRTIEGLEREITELETELLGEWAPRRIADAG